MIWPKEMGINPCILPYSYIIVLGVMVDVRLRYVERLGRNGYQFLLVGNGEDGDF